MDDVFVCDTHPLIWFSEGSSSLSGLARRLIGETIRRERSMLLPSIVLAEASAVVAKHSKSFDPVAFLGDLPRTGFRLIPFDDVILRRFLAMPATLDIHDRIIVATALEHGGSVVTKDARIVASGAVGTVW